MSDKSIINFKYGFQHENFIYGWHKKELYRLPSLSGNRSYGLKKLDIIKVGNLLGYRIKGQKFSINQLKDKTVFINKNYTIITDTVDIP